MKILFYETRLGNAPVKKFVEALPKGLQEEIISALDRLAHGEHLSMPLSRPLFNIAIGLHELRFQSAHRIYRIFYCIRTGDAIYILHAIQKTTQQLSNKDRRLILKRLKEI